VRFWDTSAVVPLCVLEPVTVRMRRLTRADPSLLVWWATRTECISALERRAREGAIGIPDLRRSRDVLEALTSAWSEVLPSDRLRERAERILGVHPLRAADALQLAAALVWSRGRTPGLELVSLDDRLRAAAGREGFTVLP